MFAPDEDARACYSRSIVVANCEDYTSDSIDRKTTKAGHTSQSLATPRLLRGASSRDLDQGDPGTHVNPRLFHSIRTEFDG